MWPDTVVLSLFVTRQRSDRFVATGAAWLGGLALAFSVFTFFAGLSGESLGERRAGLVLGILSGCLGALFLGVAARGFRRQRERLELGAAVLAGTLFSLTDLAARIGCSEPRTAALIELGRREGWLSFMGREPVYGTDPVLPQSNGIKRDQSGWTTKGQAGSRR